MVAPPPRALSLFSCYAQEDASLHHQFEKHLSMFKQLGWIQSWSDRDISAGAHRQQAINHYLHTANLLLLFISADFFNSEYGSDSAMQEAVRRHMAGEAVVIPVLLRPVEWKKIPLGSLQGLPRNGRPITSWNNLDEAFTQIAKEIGGVIEVLRRHVVLVSAMRHQTFATRLAHDLSAHGILLWQETSTEVPTSLKDGIREAAAVVMMVSSETISADTLKEAQRLSEMYQRPTIGVWIPNEKQGDRQQAPSTLHGKRWIDAGSEREDLTLQEIRASIRRYLCGAFFSPIPPSQETEHEPRNPYKGLRAFTANDARDFFGRTTVIDTLLTSVETILSLEKKGQKQARLLTVVGASGSGKSSVVKAGLLPAFQSGQVFDSNEWICLDPIVPGAHPLDALVLALFERFPEKTLNMLREDLLDESMRGLHLYATALARRQKRTHVVLIVDQFEEIFTLTTSEKERQQFFDLLVTTCTQPDSLLIVVLTLRADFYDRLMQYSDLYTLITDHLIPILPMTLPDLRAVITQPTMLPDVKLTFEENLVGDMLFDIQGQIGALPLLQFTLDQLFARREGHRLTAHAYQEIGGVKGALSKHAEETYLALPSEKHREVTRTLFLRLIDPGVTEQDTTRRRAALSELSLPDPQQTALLRQVADAFVAARLLTTNEVAGTTTIEVSHEALIREWARLAGWLREAREDIIFQQTVSADTAEWVRRSRPEDRLYRGSQLAEAQAWAARNLPNVEETSFIEASYEVQEREETEEHARQERELALQRQATRRQRYIIGLMAVTSIVLIVALVFTLFQQAQLQNTNQQLRGSLPASVINNHDSGPGSLREAIANAHPNSTITFEKDLQGPIRLTHEIDIAQSLILSGPGVNVLGISGQSKHRVFRVLNGAVVTILNLTITDGFASNCPGGCDTPGISSDHILSDNDEHAGGAILNGLHATLTLINVRVSKSTAGYGAIFNNGTLTLLGSHISANKTSGLFNSNQGTLKLEDSVVSSNIGATYGGGINSWGSATILTSTISDNTAIYGGGLYTAGNFIVATLVNSAISNNMATTSGGGICSPKYGPNLVYTTVYENRAGAIGGGIAENAGEGCGDYASDPYQNYALDLKGSIIAGNSALKDPDIAGNVSLNYPNLIQRLSSGTNVLPCDQNTSQRCVLGKKSLFNLSPRLGPLQDNGGPTPTHALLVGSPAIDQIPVDPSDPNGICANPYNIVYPVLISDQRGESRPHGKGCDLGAYEA
jgi:TIR domain